MKEIFLEKIDWLLVWAFRSHDCVSEFLAKYFVRIKTAILIVAHMSLFGIFFPEFGKDYGNAAIIVLFVIVFLSPLSKILRMRLLLQMMGLRRELGILMGYLAIVHGMTYLIPAWGTDISFLPLYFWLGIIALLLTFPLLLTANNFSLRLFGGKKWKSLHRLAYLLFVAAIFHQAFRPGRSDVLSSGQTIVVFTQAMSIVFLYGILKVLAWKNFLAPLQKAISFVAWRYSEYRKIALSSPGSAN